MSWFKVDDGFYDHEKVDKLAEGPCESHALALWLKSGNWCARAEKDGHVPHGTVLKFARHPEAASELVRVGLWHVTETGYLFHDWADYQPSGEALQERRRKGAERKAKSRARLSSTKEAAGSDNVSRSQRDCRSVREESAPRLASASRDRERSDLNSSSEISEQVPVHNFRPPLGDPPPEALAELAAAGPPKRSDWAIVWELYAEAMNKLTPAMGKVDTDSAVVIAEAARTESGADDAKFREVVRRYFREWKATKGSVTHVLSYLAKHIGAYTREKKPEPRLQRPIPRAPEQPMDPALAAIVEQAQAFTKSRAVA